MELFKSEILKKEYEEFNKKMLPAVLECGLCNKISCQYHTKFIVSCTLCRSAACKSCKKFNISKDISLKNATVKTID